MARRSRVTPCPRILKSRFWRPWRQAGDRRLSERRRRPPRAEGRRLWASHALEGGGGVARSAGEGRSSGDRHADDAAGACRTGSAATLSTRRGSGLRATQGRLRGLPAHPPCSRSGGPITTARLASPTGCGPRHPSGDVYGGPGACRRSAEMPPTAWFASSATAHLGRVFYDLDRREIYLPVGHQDSRRRVPRNDKPMTCRRHRLGDRPARVYAPGRRTCRWMSREKQGPYADALALAQIVRSPRARGSAGAAAASSPARRPACSKN